MAGLLEHSRGWMLDFVKGQVVHKAKAVVQLVRVHGERYDEQRALHLMTTLSDGTYTIFALVNTNNVKGGDDLRKQRGALIELNEFALSSTLQQSHLILMVKACTIMDGAGNTIFFSPKSIGEEDAVKQRLARYKDGTLGVQHPDEQSSPKGALTQSDMVPLRILVEAILEEEFAASASMPLDQIEGNKLDRPSVAVPRSQGIADALRATPEFERGASQPPPHSSGSTNEATSNSKPSSGSEANASGSARVSNDENTASAKSARKQNASQTASESLELSSPAKKTKLQEKKTSSQEKTMSSQEKKTSSKEKKASSPEKGADVAEKPTKAVAFATQVDYVSPVEAASSLSPVASPASARSSDANASMAMFATQAFGAEVYDASTDSSSSSAPPKKEKTDGHVADDGERRVSITDAEVVIPLTQALDDDRDEQGDGEDKDARVGDTNDMPPPPPPQPAATPISGEELPVFTQETRVVFGSDATAPSALAAAETPGSFAADATVPPTPDSVRARAATTTTVHPVDSVQRASQLGFSGTIASQSPSPYARGMGEAGKPQARYPPFHATQDGPHIDDKRRVEPPVTPAVPGQVSPRASATGADEGTNNDETQFSLSSTATAQQHASPLTPDTPPAVAAAAAASVPMPPNSVLAGEKTPLLRRVVSSPPASVSPTDQEDKQVVTLSSNTSESKEKAAAKKKAAATVVAPTPTIMEEGFSDENWKKGAFKKDDSSPKKGERKQEKAHKDGATSAAAATTTATTTTNTTTREVAQSSYTPPSDADQSSYKPSQEKSESLKKKKKKASTKQRQRIAAGGTATQEARGEHDELSSVDNEDLSADDDYWERGDYATRFENAPPPPNMRLAVAHTSLHGGDDDEDEHPRDVLNQLYGASSRRAVSTPLSVPPPHASMRQQTSTQTPASPKRSSSSDGTGKVKSKSSHKRSRSTDGSTKEQKRKRAKKSAEMSGAAPSDCKADLSEVPPRQDDDDDDDDDDDFFDPNILAILREGPAKTSSPFRPFVQPGDKQ